MIIPSIAVAVALLVSPTHAVDNDARWSAIIQCESGGNPKAQNKHSTASGLFQFIDGTWAAYGGREFARKAKYATPAEQYVVANRAFAREGYRPWAASKKCWRSKL